MTASRTVAGALAVATAAGAAFIVLYALRVAARYDVVALALAAAALAVAAGAWAVLFGRAEVVDEIDDYPSSGADRAGAARALDADVAAVTRRRALSRWLVAALAVFAAALVVPLRSLGPAPARTLFTTRWRRGDRLLRDDGRFVRANDLEIDSTVTVFPEHAQGDAQSQVALVRLPAALAPATRGYVAYSRVCTHAGCPVALYRAAAKQLLCPCHQSVFDVTRDGAVVAGPADHALPRLPITIDADGYLRAAGGFGEPVGPGFWERG